MYYGIVPSTTRHGNQITVFEREVKSMKSRAMFFKLEEGETVMVFTDESSITVKGWGNLFAPTEKFGDFPIVAYKAVLDTIIKHGGILKETITF